MNKKRKIAISLPSLGEEEWRAVKEPIESGWLTQGAKVQEFEELFSRKHGVEHSVAVTSCTTGLHLVLTALGIGSGDEVIVPAFTWVATANVVLHCGATPVFVDIDTATFNIASDKVASKVTARTKAIILVHLFGLCADVDAIRASIPDHIKIVEDAACAVGSVYKERPAGSLGDAAVFSFHPRKIITTGEGGMITTDDDQLAHRLRQLRSHGASVSEEERHLGPKPYILPDFKVLGYNYRMTDLQGAIGYVQLKKLDGFIEERTKWAAWYCDQLADVDWLQLPQEPEFGKHAWQAFVLLVNPDKAPMSRNAIMERLQELGVSTRPGTHAVHMLELYRDLYGISPDDYPNARLCNDLTIAIPIHSKMAQEDYAYVVSTLKGI